MQVPRLYVQWPTRRREAATIGSRSTCSARSSPAPRTARLTKALVYDEQAAASVSAGQSTNEDVGEFILIDHAAARALADRPRSGGRRDHRAAQGGRADGRGDSEGDRRRGARASCSSLESNLGKAFRLSDGAGYHGDAGYFRTDYKKTLAVTAADVKRVANKYLTSGRVVLSIVPTGKLDQAAKPDQSKTRDRLRHARNRRVENDRRMRIIAGGRLARVSGRCRVSLTASAQQALDRKKVPAPGKPPDAARAGVDEERRSPTAPTSSSSEKHDLPLVSFSHHLPRRRESVRARGQAGRRRR